MNMGTRIQQRLRELGWRQVDLLERVPDLSPGTLSAIIKRGGIRSVFAKPIADAMRVRLEWLLYGLEPKELQEITGTTDTTYDINVSSLPAAERKIPLISAVQAGAWREIVDNFEPGDAERWLEWSGDIGKHAFALTVRGNSMMPEFKDGDIIVIDPDVVPAPGDYVIACNHEDEATFKKYRPRGIEANGREIFELVPLNEDFPSMRSDTQHIQIIGKVVEHRKRF